MTINNKSLSKILKFFSLQGLVQILDLVTSFIIIRTLPKEQYSLYLLSLSITMSLNVLSDMGVGSVVLSEGGKVWSQRDKMANLMFAYAHFRKKLALIFAILVVSTSGYLFYLNQFSLFQFLTALSLMIVDFLFKFRYYGSKYVLQLAGDIIVVQKLETLANAGKFFLIATIAFTGWANGISILIPLTMSSAAMMLMAEKQVNKYIDTKINDTKEYFNIFKSKIINQMPFNIYSFYQGQINNFILSIFGTTLLLADFNVLMKVGIFNTIINAFVFNYVAPLIVKTQSFRAFISLYIKYFIFALGLSLFFSTAIVVFKQYFIVLIGTSFNTVLPYFLPMAFFVNLQMIASFAISINYASGLTDKFWMIIPATILTQVIVLLLIDVSNLYGVILYNCIVLLPQIIISGILSFFEGRKNFIYNV